eukprot:8806092-Pyramimonas_sp.AAC.1
MGGLPIPEPSPYHQGSSWDALHRLFGEARAGLGTDIWRPARQATTFGHFRARAAPAQEAVEEGGGGMEVESRKKPMKLRRRQQSRPP